MPDLPEYRTKAPEGKLVKAALIFRDKLYTGWRHADIRNQIMDETKAPREEVSALMSDKWSVGFITENGRFLTRMQAFVYGRNRNQIGEIIGSELTSEDLWDIVGKPHAK
jgi:hypothetical protein